MELLNGLKATLRHGDVRVRLLAWLLGSGVFLWLFGEEALVFLKDHGRKVAAFGVFLCFFAAAYPKLLLFLGGSLLRRMERDGLELTLQYLFGGIFVGAGLLAPLMCREPFQQWFVFMICSTSGLLLLLWKDGPEKPAGGSVLQVDYSEMPVIKPESDAFGMRHHARYEANILRKEKPRTFGICGDWGTGKTSFTRLILYELETKKEGEITPKIAFFNPWRARTRQEAWEMLGKALNVALGTDEIPKFLALLKRAAPLRKVVPGLEPIGDVVLDYLENGSRYDDSAIEKVQTRLDEELRGGHLFVMVDDAERAEAEIARDVFAMVEELRTLTKCTFIFAIDRAALKHAFEGDVSRAEGFFSKIVPRYRDVPVPKDEDVKKWLSAQCEDASKLQTVISDIYQFMPKTLRGKQSFILYAKTFEQVYLSPMEQGRYSWKSVFLLRLIEFSCPGFAQYCRRKEIKGKLRALADNPLRKDDRFFEDIGSLFVSSNVSNEWLMDVVVQWLGMLRFTELNFTLDAVLQMGVEWHALHAQSFDTMLLLWTESPRGSLLALMEGRTYGGASEAAAANLFIIRLVQRYGKCVERYAESSNGCDASEEGLKAIQILNALKEYLSGQAAREDMEHLSFECKYTIARVASVPDIPERWQEDRCLLAVVLEKLAEKVPVEDARKFGNGFGGAFRYAALDPDDRVVPCCAREIIAERVRDASDAVPFVANPDLDLI